jgi:hypothetical protein
MSLRKFFISRVINYSIRSIIKFFRLNVNLLVSDSNLLIFVFSGVVPPRKLIDILLYCKKSFSRFFMLTTPAGLGTLSLTTTSFAPAALILSNAQPTSNP